MFVRNIIKYHSKPPVNLMQICPNNTMPFKELNAINWKIILSTITANRSLMLTLKNHPAPVFLYSWYTTPAAICAPVKPATDARAIGRASLLITKVIIPAAHVSHHKVDNSSVPVFFSCIKHLQIKSNGISKKEENIKPVAPKCLTIKFAATKASRKRT